MERVSTPALTSERKKVRKPMAQRKNESEAIENLQRYLRQLSYTEEISPPPIDGVFESDTRRALEQFQALYGLPVTGSATPQTWEMLYAAYRASLISGAPPRAVLILPPNTKTDPLKLGTRAFAVTVLQHMLRELSSLYSTLENVALTGTYDEATSAAVKDFQEKNGLLASGEVDLATWNAITDQYNILFSTEPFL